MIIRVVGYFFGNCCGVDGVLNGLGECVDGRFELGSVRIYESFDVLSFVFDGLLEEIPVDLLYYFGFALCTFESHVFCVHDYANC